MANPTTKLDNTGAPHNSNTNPIAKRAIQPPRVANLTPAQWKLVENEYVYNGSTTRQTAAKFNLTVGVVAAHCWKDNWSARRLAWITACAAAEAQARRNGTQILLPATDNTTPPDPHGQQHLTNPDAGMSAGMSDGMPAGIDDEMAKRITDIAANAQTVAPPELATIAMRHTKDDKTEMGALLPRKRDEILRKILKISEHLLSQIEERTRAIDFQNDGRLAKLIQMLDSLVGTIKGPLALEDDKPAPRQAMAVQVNILNSIMEQADQIAGKQGQRPTEPKTR